MIRHFNLSAGSRAAPMIAAAACLSLSLSACGITPDEERAAVERGILTSPDSGQLFAVIKEEYPEELDDLITQILAVPAAEMTETRAQDLGAEWIQTFMIEIAPDAVQAPADTLLIWSAVEAELYETLQRSAEDDCAKMTMGGWVVLAGENTAARAAIERRSIAMVRAAAAGRDDPQDYAEPGEAELNQLGDAIAATGLDPDLQALFGQIPEMQALPASDQCAMGAAFYQGITALPDDVEPVVAAYMLTPE